MTEPSRIKIRHIVPSAVTVFAICAGMTSVRMSLDGRIEMALYFILLAVFLDAADGKLARFLDTASPFGAELDTLADFFNFGIVPGMLLYNTLYINTTYANLGFLATLILAVCCALRLARFNLSLHSDAVTLNKHDYFVGVPAPALACLALMPVFMHLNGFENTNLPVLRAIYIIGVGLLAVSTIPTFSIRSSQGRCLPPLPRIPSLQHSIFYRICCPPLTSGGGSDLISLLVVRHRTAHMMMIPARSLLRAV